MSCSKSENKLHVIYQPIMLYLISWMLKQLFYCNRSGLHHWVKVHISIALTLYQPLHLPTPPRLFLEPCLLDVYLHGNPNTKEGKGKRKEGLLCKSRPAVEPNECVKQINHEMAFKLTVVCFFHLKCIEFVLKGCWTVLKRKCAWYTACFGCLAGSEYS